MRLSRPLHAFALGFIAAAALSAFAQNPPASPLDEIRANPDREKLTAWIRDRVHTIATNGATAGQASGELRTEYTGPDAFKNMFAQVSIEQVRAELRGAKGPGAGRLVTVLIGLPDAPATELTPIFVEGMASEEAGVRAACASGLRVLRSKIGAAGPLLSTVIPAVRDAAKKETSAGALKAEYLALEYGEAGVTVSDPRAVLDAYVDILDSRAAQFAANTPKADGADHVGIRAALAFKAQLDDAGRKKFAAAAARMLKFAVARYAGGDHPLLKVKDDGPAALVAARDNAELLIEEAERAVRELLSATTGPNVATAMKKGKADEMKAEMDRWVEPVKTATGVDIGALGD